ncbi:MULTISPECIES: hypothetical protein, partial [Curtobacterium]|uniref:hypothetical protein n=1 Tax=Curtobacterium flaccumfaciens TaxID=2035 RepID=UPI003EE79317
MPDDGNTVFVGARSSKELPDGAVVPVFVKVNDAERDSCSGITGFTVCFTSTSALGGSTWSNPHPIVVPGAAVHPPSTAKTPDRFEAPPLGPVTIEVAMVVLAEVTTASN